MSVGHLLTLQAFAEKHLKPPSPIQGSLNDIFTEKFKAFVKGLGAVIYAVGGTVSAKKSKKQYTLASAPDAYGKVEIH